MVRYYYMPFCPITSQTSGEEYVMVDPDSASGSSLACKRLKHHDETWSIILGPMFSRKSNGKGDSDISAFDAQEQAVDKEFQKYLAEDLISIDDNPLKW